MDAAASVVGIVSFGLGLAKSLQAFIDSVIEAEETITLIVAEVNTTASTLKRLQDVIDQDKAASEEEHRATVFNSIGIKEVDVCALQCQKIYVQIIVLIEKASMQNGEDGSKDISSQGPAADGPVEPAIRLAVFSKNVTKLGRKMKWPWLEPRIKRCQEHLGRLKISLLLSLQVFSIAQSRSRSVARIFGTDEESELRDRAEMLRKKMTELRAKKGSPKQANRQPTGSDNGISEGTNAKSSTTSSSVVIRDWSSSTSSRRSTSSTTSSTTTSLASLRRPRSQISRRLRINRAMSAFRAFKVHIRRRTERRSVFKKDLTSVTFEAYLIHPGPFQGSLPGGISSGPLVKLPFGHRRLKREVKRALRKCNPWDILLVLSPYQRALVDRVVQQVQTEAHGITNVCLIAIDVDGYSDAGITDSEPGGLVWTRMVLFFRHEPVQAPEGTTEAGIDMIGNRPRLTATVRNIFLGSRQKTMKRLELQEVLKRKREEKTRDEDERKQQELKDKIDAEIAKRDEETRIRQEEERITQQKQKEHDRRVADEARSQLLETQRQEQDNERMRQEERAELEEKIKKGFKLKEMIARLEQEYRADKGKDAVESTHQALKDAEAVLEDIKKGIGEEEQSISEAERIKKTLEEDRARMKVAEEAKVAEKTKLPLKFKDAVGRKFNFPFHLVQTWKGMEDLIKQAFLHVEVIGPHVQEGHYDLLDSKEQIILPSLWSATIKPGETVSVRMWPIDKYPLPGQQHHMTPEQQIRFEAQRRQAAVAAQFQASRGYHHGGHHVGRVPPMGPLPGFTGVPVGVQPPPPPGMRPFPLPGGLDTRSAMGGFVDGGRPKKDKAKRAKKTLAFFSGTKPSKKSSRDKHKHPKPRIVEVRDDADSEVTDKDESLGDIDKELGLDDLEGAEEMAARDIDELLETWTNVGGDK